MTLTVKACEDLMCGRCERRGPVIAGIFGFIVTPMYRVAESKSLAQVQPWRVHK